MSRYGNPAETARRSSRRFPGPERVVRHLFAGLIGSA